MTHFIIRVLEKSKDRANHKYIRKIVGTDGKSRYIYAEDLRHPVQTLKSFFGIGEKKASDLYEKNGIQRDFNVTRETFFQHLINYFVYRDKWDAIFSKKTIKHSSEPSGTRKAAAEKKEKTDEAGKKTSASGQGNNEGRINRNLMRRIWQIYNPGAGASTVSAASGVKAGSYIVGNIYATDEGNGIYFGNDDSGRPMFENTTDKNTVITGSVDKQYASMGRRTGYQREDAATASDNRSDGMKGNQNAKKDISEKDLEKLKSDISNAFDETAVEFPVIALTEDNYNKYFPRGEMKTPIENVKIGENQLKKLKEKNREELTGSIIETLKNPTVIIEERRDGEKDNPHLYIKSFKRGDNNKIIMSVVVSINNMHISISTHEKDKNNILNKIKMADQILFTERPVSQITNQYTKSAVTRSTGSNDNYLSGNIAHQQEKSSIPQTEHQRHAEQQREKESRKKAGLPPADPVYGSSLVDDTDDTFDPASPDYRYKDTGYIAGSRKEMAQAYLAECGRKKRRAGVNDIDWKSLEENPRAAEKYITKSNVFGSVDWDTLKSGGMTGGAAFLIDRIYASAGSKPDESSPEARRNYVIAINGLRDRFETCKTVDDVIDTLDEIKDERIGVYQSVKDSPEYKKLSDEYDALIKETYDLRNKEDAYYKALNKKRSEIQQDVIAKYKKFLVDNKIIRGNSKVYGVNDWNYRDKTIPAAMKEKIESYQNELNAESARRINDSPENKEYQKFSVEHPKDKYKTWKETDSDGNVHLYSGGGDFNSDKIRELESEMKSTMLTEGAKLILSNPLYKAWVSLGGSCLINGRYNTTFAAHRADARAGKYDDWSWLKQDKISTTKGTDRKARFEMIVADNFTRKGGENVSVKSTQELKQMFNLRDIQSGNWVLKDPESAKWHIDRCCEGFADLCDVTGIPKNLISLNGRLALAIGARGKGLSSAIAHYEPTERVINITKMKGGGALAHEWFHAFDNLLTDAMTGGNVDQFITNPLRDWTDAQKNLLKSYYSFKKQGQTYYAENIRRQLLKAGRSIPEESSAEGWQATVRNAFSDIVTEMTEGSTEYNEKVIVKKSDFDNARFNFYHYESNKDDPSFNQRKPLYGLAFGSADFNEANRKIVEYFKKNNLNDKKSLASWVRLAYCHFNAQESDTIGNGKATMMWLGSTGSDYYANAVIEDGYGADYYQSTHEMAARAFQAYIEDKLKAENRQDDYLACRCENKYQVDLFGHEHKIFPEGEERNRLNAAFDKLFEIVKGNNAIRKSLYMADMPEYVIYHGKLLQKSGT